MLVRRILGFPCGSTGKELPAMWETWAQSLGWEDPLEKGTATHFNILAWRIPWTVWSMGHKESDTTEQLSLFQNSFRGVKKHMIGSRGIYEGSECIFM